MKSLPSSSQTSEHSLWLPEEELLSLREAGTLPGPHLIFKPPLTPSWKCQLTTSLSSTRISSSPLKEEEIRHLLPVSSKHEPEEITRPTPACLLALGDSRCSHREQEKKEPCHPWPLGKLQCSLPHLKKPTLHPLPPHEPKFRETKVTGPFPDTIGGQPMWEAL